MADQNLVDYVRSSLSQGYSADSVRQALVQQGWDPGSINEAFALASGSMRSQAYMAPTPQQGQAAAQPGKRPMLVTVLCAIGFIFSVISILIGIAALLLGSLFGALGGSTLGGEENTEALGMLGSLVMLASIIPLVTGAVGIAVFILLLKMKRKGFLLTIVLGAISIAYGIYTLNVLGIAFWVFAIVVMVIHRKDFR
ncbi:MAG: hypothetical protein V1813_00645 [Candidatus Aenigmatarchaeota archaeon]